MFKSIWDDMVHYFKTGNMVVRLILVNVAIFIGVSMISVFMNTTNGFGPNPSFDMFIKFFSVSADLQYLVFHPWGLITCMFLHYSFGHVFWNMIWLYWFGRIAGDMLSDKRILSIYFMGGLFGALCFVISAQFIGFANPSYAISHSLGASGAVMAITMAAGTVAPDYRINLILFETKLKYIVAVIIFLDIVGASSISSSTTDHFAHLGGAFFGWYFVYLLRKGTDLSVPFNNFADRITGLFNGRAAEARRPKPKVAFKNKEKIKQNQQQPGRQSDYGSVQERVDAILDKINRKGMSSLTPEEKSFLNDYHNKLD